MKYKNYIISSPSNEWGYFEATPQDCDATMIHAKSIEQLKIEIDEREEVAVCQFDTGSECRFNGECPYLCTELPKCSQQTDC